MTSQRSVSHTPAYGLGGSVQARSLATSLAGHDTALLREWAFYCVDGKSKGDGSAPDSRKALSEDPLWTVLHVERFFDASSILGGPVRYPIALRHLCFRSFALAAHAWFPDIDEAVDRWRWRLPGEPITAAIARLDWGWVRDPADPLPEVAAMFQDRFASWSIANPRSVLLAGIMEDLGGTLQGDDPDKRLVTIRTACVLLNVRDRKSIEEGSQKPYAIRSIRRWCEEGKMRGAVRFNEWAIPMGTIRNWNKPRRGRKPKKGLQKC